MPGSPRTTPPSWIFAPSLARGSSHVCWLGSVFRDLVGILPAVNRRTSTRVLCVRACVFCFLDLGAFTPEHACPRSETAADLVDCTRFSGRKIPRFSANATLCALAGRRTSAQVPSPRALRGQLTSICICTIFLLSSVEVVPTRPPIYQRSYRSGG